MSKVKDKNSRLFKALSVAMKSINSDWNPVGWISIDDADPGAATNDLFFPEENGVYPNLDSIEVNDYEREVIVKGSTGYIVEDTWSNTIDFYPYKNRNTITHKFKDGIVELFLPLSKEAGHQYILNSIRRAQVSSAWSNLRRSEINIRDFTTGTILFDYVSYDHDEGESGIQLLGNNNVKIVIDWSRIGYGEGYGGTSLDFELADSVFAVEANPYIAAYLNSQDITNIQQDISNFNVDVIDINSSINSIYNQVNNVADLSPIWYEEGLSSAGGLNGITTQSHTDFIEAKGKDLIVASQSIFRINLYKADETPISQSPFNGGTEYTLPDNDDIGLIRIASGVNYATNNTTIKVVSDYVAYNYKNAQIINSHVNAANPHNITPDLIGAVKDVVYGGAAAAKTNGTVTIDNSTPSRSGLMSKEDKAKLDGIAVSPITITGSGVTKNASDFGFLPTATASENVTALQNAVNGGGTILIDYPGTYLVNDTVLLDSNTKLIFGANVFVSLQANKRFLLNRGALTREYNEQIQVIGLNLIANERPIDYPVITGLRGYVAFFYIKKLIIKDFTLLDGGAGPYVIHVCRFEDAQFLNIHIEGWKDAIHLGTGSKFVIKHGVFMTFDDPIALNAHDYTSGQPEYGWIDDGIIEDCYDLADPVRGTTGYFARILAGAWVDWYSGMSIQSSGDTVVASNGKLYKSNGTVNSTIYTSTVEPDFASGTQTLSDGIRWTMMQENGVGYTAGVRRVTFRNIYLQKPRGTAFSIHFDKDIFSRSYYPNAESPIQEDLLFDGIFYNAELTNFISCRTPINTIKVVNSIFGNTKIDLNNLGTTGIQYGTTRILISNVTFKGSGSQNLIESDIPSTVKIVGSIVEDDTYAPIVSGNVTIVNSDI